MKNSIILLILAVLFSSCNLFFEDDNTANISTITYKPVINLLGDNIVSLQKGQSYNDPGANVVVGDTTNYKYTKIGIANTDSVGFYILTYQSQNGWGWKNEVYRAILVWDGQPYVATNIEGKYKYGFLPSTYFVTKHQTPGYYSMENAVNDRSDFPIVFAENGDGINFTIVPGNHPSVGKYYGTVKKVLQGSRVRLEITITTETPKKEGGYIISTKKYIWTKQ